MKPENVLVVDGARVKLLDFGLARRFEPGETMTLPGSFIGTPGYAAPEITLGISSRDKKSDLYAAGAIWWEMLTGRTVFTAPNPIALSLRHATDPPDLPSLYVTVPKGIEQTIMKLLDKEPNRRPEARQVLAFLRSLSGP